MSLRAMTSAVAQDVGNPLRKLVLMILADEHREDTDLCFPGLERIAAIGEMSTKSAARHIDALAEGGWITIYKRGRPHGYTLQCPPKVDSVSDGAPTTDPRDTGLCVTDAGLSVRDSGLSVPETGYRVLRTGRNRF